MMKTHLIKACAILFFWLPVHAASQPIPFERCFELASRQHEVKIDLLMAVAYQESSWNAQARSAANAHGIMQIRWPLTARHLGSRRVAELYNPCLNIDLGARYLRELNNRYNGDTSQVLAAYNYGPTRIKSREDIPASVWRYINAVKQHQKWISRRLDFPTANIEDQLSNLIELIRFEHHDRALRYLSSLKKAVPGASLSLSKKQNIIFLNRDLSSSEAHYRLGRIMPFLLSDQSVLSSASQSQEER